MKRFFKIILFLIFALLLDSCTRLAPDADKKPLLEVAGKFLYNSDLQAVIPAGATAADSTAVAESFIRQWVTNTLLYDKARHSLNSTAEIDNLVENYHKSLVIQQYEQSLLDRQASAQPSEEQIAEFYKQHREQLLLKDNYICGIFIVLAKNAPKQQNVRAWVLKGGDASLENIEKYCLENAISYNYYGDWTDFIQIAQRLPDGIGNQADFVSKNKFYETQDSTQHYFLKIEKFCTVGQQQPYELAKPQIIELINFKARTDFINSFTNGLYENAVKNKLITKF